MSLHSAAPKPREALTGADVARVRAMVVHEDASVLALNKPSGLSSQGGRGQFVSLDDLLEAFARSNGKRPQLVHRLDRDTSGVILAAKTQPAAAALGRALMARRVAKRYLAIVETAPALREGMIELPLRREAHGREAYTRVCAIDHPDAQVATSRYRTLASGSRAGALLELRPETGRMHQLRVHLTAIGSPLAGDARYGGALVLGATPVSRLMLHALEIDFPHPEGGRRSRLGAPLPVDFEALLDTLGLILPGAPAA